MVSVGKALIDSNFGIKPGNDVLNSEQRSCISQQKVIRILKCGQIVTRRSVPDPEQRADSEEAT